MRLTIAQDSKKCIMLSAKIKELLVTLGRSQIVLPSNVFGTHDSVCDCRNLIFHSMINITSSSHFLTLSIRLYIQIHWSAKASIWSSLSNEASDVISSLEISDFNLPGKVAWRLLKERYDNNKVIMHTHIRIIMEFPSKKNSSWDKSQTALPSTYVLFRYWSVH